MDENQTTQTATALLDERLPVGAPVRYEGSMERFHGLSGTVTERFELRGQTVYSIDLDLPGAGVQDLHRVRRQSLVVIEGEK